MDGEELTDRERALVWNLIFGECTSMISRGRTEEVTEYVKLNDKIGLYGCDLRLAKEKV